MGVAANVAAIVKLFMPTATEGQPLMNVLMQAAKQIGLACVAGAGAGALFLGGLWCLTRGLSLLTPRRRFMSMADELDSILREEIGSSGLFSAGYPDRYQFLQHAIKCEEIRVYLVKLRIKAPVLPSGVRTVWVRFVGDMVQYARIGDLKQARNWRLFG